MRDPRAVDPLTASLKDEDFRVRQDAVWALGAVKDPRAINPLIQLLLWEHQNIQFGKIYSMGKITYYQKTEEHSFIRERIIEALGKVGAPAVTPLIDALYNAIPEINK